MHCKVVLRPVHTNTNVRYKNSVAGTICLFRPMHLKKMAERLNENTKSLPDSRQVLDKCSSYTFTQNAFIILFLKLTFHTELRKSNFWYLYLHVFKQPFNFFFSLFAMVFKTPNTRVQSQESWFQIIPLLFTVVL